MITIIKNYDLSDVKRSMKQFIDQGASDETVHSIALMATAGSTDHIAAIYDWMKNNSEYVADPVESELLIAPKRLAEHFYNGEKIHGDCDDLAMFATSLYKSVGLQSKVAIIDLDGKGFNHAICLVKGKSDWIPVDLASKYPLGWQTKFFDITYVE